MMMAGYTDVIVIRHPQPGAVQVKKKKQYLYHWFGSLHSKETDQTKMTSQTCFSYILFLPETQLSTVHKQYK